MITFWIHYWIKRKQFVLDLSQIENVLFLSIRPGMSMAKTKYSTTNDNS